MFLKTLCYLDAGKQLGVVIPYRVKSFNLIRTDSIHSPAYIFMLHSNSITRLSVA